MKHSTKRLIAVVSVFALATAGAFAGLGTAQTSDQITITVTDSKNGQYTETVGVTVSSDYSGSLTFNDQTPDADNVVTVEDVSTDQNSTVIVTYANNGENIVAGTATADNLNGKNVSVEIQDQGGFPGKHKAWVFADNDLTEDLTIGEDAAPVTSEALNSDTATVTDQDVGEAPESFPESAEKFDAIDTNDDSTLGPIEIATAITDNAEQGNVGGVEISPIEFARIISWNAE